MATTQQAEDQLAEAETEHEESMSEEECASDEIQIDYDSDKPLHTLSACLAIHMITCLFVLQMEAVSVTGTFFRGWPYFSAS